MPPVISVVGIGNVGKTTFIEKLVAELKSRGYRVATIKHTPAGMTYDEQGRDSWRHLQAGSDATAVSSPERVVLVKPAASELSLEEVARLMGEDYDIILAEGFKQSSAPKIEVHRRAVGPPLGDLTKLIAIVTDETLKTEARQFALDDVKGIADLLEKGFIIPQRERISLYVNNTPVVLTSLPREIITNIVMALASSLKGVGEIKSIDISLRRATKRD